MAVCSRDTAKTIVGIDDLRRVPFLAISGTSEDSLIWAESLGLPSLLDKHSARFDSSLLAIEAAISGQGVVVVPQFLVEADLRSGNLVIPVQSDVMQPGGWYLAHLQRRGDEPPIRRFIEWILAL